MKTGVWVKKIHGDVLIFLDNEFKNIEKEYKLGVNKSYEIITKDKTYAQLSTFVSPESKKQEFFLLVFPDSRIKVLTGRGNIKKTEIIQGIIYLSSPQFFYNSIVEIKEIFASTSIIEYKDGTITIADGRNIVNHKKTNASKKIDINQQITATEEYISDPKPMDNRFYEIKKTINEICSFDGAEMYKNIYEKSDEFLNSVLYVNSIMAQKTGQDFEKIKEEIEKDFKMYKQWAKKEMENNYELQEKIKNANYDDVTENIEIGKELKYSKLDIKIISIQKQKINDKKSKLMIKLKVENKSSNEIFIFWNEEVRLINNSDEIIQINDYNITTDYIAGAIKEGYLFTDINTDDNKFIMQFGKKSLPKTDIEINLLKNN